MNVLVIVAHSDDEVLGCGGTIAKHVADGDTVGIFAMTDGVSSREQISPDSSIERDSAFSLSCKNLGVHSFGRFNFPDNEMDKVSLLDVIKEIEALVHKHKPEIIYTHFLNDLNIDHQIVHKAVITACRPVPKFSVKEIRTFEVVSSSHWNTGKKFEPNLFIDISLFGNLKKASLRIYDEEMRDWPHQRSYEAIESLQKFRGSMVGLESVEAFNIVRKIVN